MIARQREQATGGTSGKFRIAMNGQCGAPIQSCRHGKHRSGNIHFLR